MKNYQRYLLAAAIIIGDLLFFALPLTAFVAGYIIIARPRWFEEFVENIYS